MKIFKVINNNMVSVKNADGSETMYKGLSIGYGKKPGDDVDKAKIEKCFVLESQNVARKFNDVVLGIDKGLIDACVDIVSDIIKNSKEPLSNNLYLTIIDHVNLLMSRLKEGYVFDNSILWDLKRIYPEEYELAKIAIRELSDRLEMQIPGDEASFVTLHIVSAEKSRTMENAYKITKAIDDILKLISMDVPFFAEGNEYYYNRFVNHLRFLIENQGNRTNGIHNRNNMLLATMSTTYPVLANVIEKVNDYLKKNMNWDLSNDEKLYLIIHLVQFFHN